MQLLSGSCVWFWRVLGCPHVRCHWKHNIVDTFTHHFCTNGHGWTIGTSFPYIRKSKRQHSSPVQYIAFLLILIGSTLCSTGSITTQTFYNVRDSLLCCMLCCTTGYGPCHWDPCQCLLHWAQAAKRPIHFGLLVVDKVILGMLAIGLNYDLKSDISTALAVRGYNGSLYW